MTKVLCAPLSPFFPSSPVPSLLSSKPFFVVQSLSHVRLFVTLCMQDTSFPVLHYLPEFTKTHVH